MHLTSLTLCQADEHNMDLCAVKTFIKDAPSAIKGGDGQRRVSGGGGGGGGGSGGCCIVM
jgi:hypothetical protein